MYKLTKDGNAVIRIEDGACIPFAVGNRDYAEYHAWLTAGGVPEDAQSLDDIKADVARALVQEKQKAKAEGVVVEGTLFDTDDAARLSYIEYQLALLQDSGYTVTDWKASDGVWVTMTPVLFGKIITAWKAKQTDIFTFVKAKEVEIQGKTTKEEVASVDKKYSN